MAETKLGDLYFDVLLKDQTKAGIEAIKKQVEDTLKAGESAKTFNAAEKAQKAYNAALEKSHILQEQLMKDAIKLQEENKRTEKSMRDAAKQALAPTTPELDSTSVTAMKQKIRELMDEYNALSKAERNGSTGVGIMVRVNGLNKELALVKEIESTEQRINSLKAQYKNLTRGLNGGINNGVDVVQLEEQVRLMRQVASLRERAEHLKENSNFRATAEEAIQLQERIKYSEELIRVEERLRQAHDPNSDLNKANDIKARLQAEQAYSDVKNQQLKLQKQLQAEQLYGKQNAAAQANLDIEKRKNVLLAESMRLTAQLNSFNTPLERRNRQLKLEAQLLQQKAQLEQKLQMLDRNTKVGRDYHKNQELKAEVQLKEQLLALETKLNAYRDSSGNLTPEAQRLKQLREEWGKVQGQIEGANNSMKSQNKIMQSLSNMVRNYVGVWGAVSLIKSLYRIRGEFEMQEVALRSIMQSASQATELYGKLQSLAIESPFRFQDLLGFSKQLSAFQIPNRELFDTTKRLADLSAGLGVDMSRIILAYGQVRAASVLRGQELRQFTEAGIPMVQALADKFSELEGRVVSTGEVFDKISKRQVSFEMVKDIIGDLTDEGGRFYNHQLKQSETVYGKMQKLGDAWQIMMNNIGKSSDGFLKWTLGGLLKLISNWRNLITIITDVAVFAGIRKLLTISAAWGKTMEGIRKSWEAIGGATGAGILFLATVITDMVSSFLQAESAAKEFRDTMHETMSQTSKDVDEALKRFKDYADQLKDVHKIEKDIADARRKGQDTEQLEQTLETRRAAMNLTDAEAEKVWSELYESLSRLPNADANLARIINIQDLNERIQAALDLADAIKEVSIALENMDDMDFVTQDVWHGIFGEGLASDLDDLVSSFEALKKAQENGLQPGAIKHFSQIYEKDIDEALAEITKSVDQSLIPMLEKVAAKPWDSSEQKRAAMNNTVKMWITTIEDQEPTISGRVAAVFEDGVKRYLESGNFNFMDGIDLDASETALQRFFEIVTTYTKKNNLDLRKIINGESEVTLKELGKKIKQNGLDNNDLLYYQYKKLCDKLESLTPRLTVYAGIQVDSELQKYLKTFGFDTSGIPKDVSLTDSPDYLKMRVDDLNKDISVRKSMLAAKKKQKAAQKEINAIESDINNLEAEKKQYQSELQTSFNTTYNGKEEGRAASKAAKAAKKEETAAEKREKERIKHILQQRELIERGLAEYDRLRKEMGEQDALDFIINISEVYKNLKDDKGNNLLRKWADDRAGLYRDTIKKLSQVPKEALKFSQHSKDAATKEEEKEIKEKANTQLEIINKAAKELKAKISVAAKNWKLYDELFGLTGDEEMSGSVAFGGERVFDNYIDYLRSMLKDQLVRNEEVISVDELLGWDANRIEESQLPQHIKDLAKQTKDAAEQLKSEVFRKGAKAIAEGLGIAGEISQADRDLEKWKKDYIRSGGKEGDAMWDAMIAATDKKEAELNSRLIEESEWWKSLVDDTANATLNKLRRTADNISSTLDGARKDVSGRGWWVENDEGDEVLISDKEYKELKKRLKDLRKELKENSATDFFKDIKNEWDKEGSTPADKIELVALAIGRINKEFDKAADPMKEFFSALGNEDAADTIELIQEELKSTEQIMVGLAEMACGDYLGGALTAVGGIFSAITSFFNFHDKKMNRIIEKSKLEYTKLKNAYDNMSKLIERTLGGAYRATSGSAYRQQLELLKRQRDELERQRRAEINKKNSDKNAVEDYNQQLAELEDTIEHFAEDTLKELMDVDLKSWSDKIAQNLVDAFAAGENAAKAFDKSVAELIKDMVQNMAALYILEPVMEDVKDYLFGEDGKSGVFGSDLKLTPDEIPGLIERLLKVDEAISTVGDLWDTISDAYKKYTGKSLEEALGGKGGGTIGQGIQSITEDTANLLASYVNAIRADLSMIRLMNEQMRDASTNPIAQAQITALNSIVENTRRNAEAAESINSALRSVIAVGSSGNKIRV